MTDFEEIARRSFDQQLDADEVAALRVWADALESQGDPRGELISLELAIADKPERRRFFQHAMHQHLAEHGAGLFGGVAPLLQFKRALELDWRAGRLYGVFLDTRHAAKKTQLSPSQLVKMLLAAPATEPLRRLHVRVRQSHDVADVMKHLAGTKHPRPLEEVVVMTGVRAGQLGGAIGGRWIEPMLATYQHLRMLVVDRTILELPIGGVKGLDSKLSALHAAGNPDEPDGRTVLGRSLLATETSLRAGAAERAALLGPAAFMYVDTLLALLAPGIVTPQAPFARCLRTIGSHARRAVPQLAKITGRADHYDQETRSVAGVAIASLIAAPVA